MKIHSNILTVSQVFPHERLPLDESDSGQVDVCLTLDTDFASAETIQYTTAIFSEYGLPFSLFCTDANVNNVDAATLTMCEIGLHPNYRRFFEEPERRPQSPADLMSELVDIFPDAKTVRSHSLVRSSTLSPLFLEFGMTHESNIFISPPRGARVFSWRDFSGMVQVPIIFSNDQLLANKVSTPLDLHNNVRGLQVYLFHPIHVLLNSSNTKSYQEAKKGYTDWEYLVSLRNVGRGTETILRDLLETLA